MHIATPLPTSPGPGWPSTRTPRQARFVLVFLFAVSAFLAPSLRGAPTPLPLLRLEATLGWNPLYAQDPLPLSVRLSSPQARRLALQWLEDNPGSTNAPTTASPSFGSNWMAGLELTLARQETNGEETVILRGSEWESHLATPPALLATLENDLAIRARQWWVPSAAAQLSPGDYRVSARWVGTNHLDASWLPADGTVLAAPLVFSVKVPATDGEKAAHAERRAREAFRSGNLEVARDLALQALQLAPAFETPERPDTYLLASQLTLRLRDLKTSVRVMQDLLAQWPGEHPGGFRAMIEANIDPVRPRLEVGLDATGRVFQVYVHGIPDQLYSIAMSTNLQTWIPLGTLMATNGLIRIDDAAPSNEACRFYKSQWLP